jgi:hypothetical protein
MSSTTLVLNNSNHIDIILIAFIPLILLIIMRVACWVCYKYCPCSCCCSNKIPTKNDLEKNIKV